MPERLAGPSMLALVGDLHGPALWRCLQPITALEARGYPCGWDRVSNPAVSTIAGDYDGLILPRLSWPVAHRAMARRWFELARSRGQFVVFEADDDVFSTAMTRHALSAGLAVAKSFEQLEAERHDTVWAMRQCDGVTVSTEPLAGIVRALTDRPVIVIPNAIDVPWFRRVLGAAGQRRRASGTCTVGWAGGQRDEADLSDVAEAWRRIAVRYPAVRFVVAGHRSPTLIAAVPPDRLDVRPWLPIERYPANLAGLTIGCAALDDSAFNGAKSDIKCLEYAVAGAAVVASPTVYGSLVENGRNGLIADTADEWTAALADLVERPAYASMLARRLLRSVERERSLSGNLHRWPEAWGQIAEDTRSRRGRLVAV